MNTHLTPLFLLTSAGWLSSQAVEVVPAQTVVARYEPLIVAVGVRNDGKEPFRVHIAVQLLFERRVANGHDYEWVGLAKEPIVHWLDRPPARIGPQHSHLVAAGATYWVEQHVKDQRVILTTGKYRYKASLRIERKLVSSEWQAVEVEPSSANSAALKVDSEAYNAYLVTMQASDGFHLRGGGSSLRTGVYRCIRLLSEVELSRGLRERFSLFEAQGLVRQAELAEARDKKEDLVRRAMILLKDCDSERFRLPTGGLGDDILMTYALCARETGRVEDLRERCEDIVRMNETASR